MTGKKYTPNGRFKTENKLLAGLQILNSVTAGLEEKLQDSVSLEKTKSSVHRILHSLYNLFRSLLFDITLMEVTDYSNACKMAADYVKSKLDQDFVPKIGIVCGSAMQAISDLIKEERKEILFAEIPSFVQNTVMKKSPSKLIFGIIEDTPVVALMNPCKYYEGYSLRDITIPIRVMNLLGVSIIIMTNASASINPEFKIGDIGIITDHISFPSISGLNPLIGPNYSTMGPRVLSLSDAYSFRLSKLAFKLWLESPELNKRKVNLKECTYFYSVGPTFETRAECEAIHTLGGDVLGCSMVPEVQVSRHCNLEVVCITLVTTTAYDYKKVSPKQAALREHSGASPTISDSYNSSDASEIHTNTRIGMSRPADVCTLVRLLIKEL
ncbi:hypothetical protein BB560_000538 [Smittium megazygosporum]|uniref:purine-nucleoside phosphorylase n=1 Tax=Smittium megazygosporum TaxID=133381 RepID=A0A2T9ZK98_9FUNG|nr:hypothetical protein BB560_000536 [Smittium megazygosporum]PVV04947.1 hypothetical protein BB560_000538 [Smittium megazygosporum]